MDEKKPLIDFKNVYSSGFFNVVVDTVTDICYIITKQNNGISAVQIMLTKDGLPRKLHYVEPTEEEIRAEIKKYFNEKGD